MVTGKKINSMAKEKNVGLMGHSTLDPILMESKRDMVNSIGLMELFILATFLVDGSKVKELILGTMEEFLLENGSKIK